MIALYLFIAFGVLFLYSTLLIYLAFLWLNSPEFITNTQYKCKTIVSVVISARNEAVNISNCLEDLIAQNYPSSLFEIIVVDDSSEDNTVEILDLFSEKHKENIKIIKLNEVSPTRIGKKAAIVEAVKIAKGNLIVTTDADCRFNENWLHSIVSFYESNNYKVIIGPVAFNEERSLFSKMQSVEFMGLIGITASFCFFNRPIMCNGANFIYEKNLFEKLKTYSKNKAASGDDIFLLLDAKANEPKGSIGFLKSREAIVYTKPNKSFSDFFMQRKRWASKASAYKDFDAVFTSLLVFFCNSLIVITLVLSIFSFKFVLYTILMLLIKSIVDFIFLYVVSGFFSLRKYFWLFLPEQFFYIIYVVLTGLLSQFGKYTWKNRQFF